MNILQKAISDIKPYQKNPRHKYDINKVAQSIKEFGFQQPIVVDRAGVIIVGHGRYEAAKSLNLKSIPVTIADLSPEKAKAYRIADNKTNEYSDWDMGLLIQEFTDLLDNNYDLELTGFDADELEKLIVGEKEGLTDEDAVPETPEEPKAQLGDIYKLGEHRLMCGDSTDVNAVDKLLDGIELNIMFTSPPYNAGKSEKLSGNTHLDDNKYQEYNDDKNQNDYLDLLNSFTNAWLFKTKCLIVNLQQLAGNKIAFIDYLNNYKNNLVDIGIWNKGHSAPQMAKNVMNSCFEYMIFLSSINKPSRAIPNANFQGTIKNVYDGKPNRNNEFSKVHGATFPVDLPEWIIKNFTKQNDLVGDCFGGTGTTLIACEKHNRKAYLMELDRGYIDVIIKRWEQYTGQKAEKIN
jgi:DNA modification methylase